MDLSKDEKNLTIAERDDVERQILEAIYSSAKEVAHGQPTGLVQPRTIADTTPYFAHAVYRKATITDWLEILKTKGMVEQVGKSMSGDYMVRLTGRGIERIKVREEDYQARNRPAINQLSNTSSPPLASAQPHQQANEADFSSKEHKGTWRIEKTVFLSYRRTNATWALAIFQDLTQNGFDVFFDFKGIASGDFESIILENIKSRAHFIVLLTPSALERCDDSQDWLRREIETALDTRRNIVPLFLDGFDFGASDQLIGRLADLRRYNGLPVPVDYFSEAMARLRDKFLNVPLDAVLHPASTSAQQAAEQQRAAAIIAPTVTQKELKEAELTRYVFTVKIKYQDELHKVEGTRAEEPYGPGSLIIYDGTPVVARYPDVEYWSRQQQAKAN